MSEEKRTDPQWENGYKSGGYHSNGYYEEEISLRELIEALLNHKKMIALITLAAVVLAALFTFVVLTPVYEARVIISMNRPDQYTSEDNLQALLSNRLSLVSFNDRNEMNIQNAQVYINSPEVVEAAMREQGFVSRPINRLMEDIKVEALNPYLFQIAVQGTEKEELLGLADEMGNQFTRVTTNEITRAINQEIVRKKRTINSLEENLEANKAQLENTPRYIVLERSILDDPSMTVVDPNANRGTVVITQETNPAYLVLLEAVTSAEMMLSTARVELGDLEHEATVIFEQLNQQETAPVRVVRSADEVMTGSPLRKVSPRTTLNLAIALVLGLMIGVFAAFFIEYWQKSKPKNA